MNSSIREITTEISRLENKITELEDCDEMIELADQVELLENELDKHRPTIDEHKIRFVTEKEYTEEFKNRRTNPLTVHQIDYDFSM